jgi:hypothetical protein
MLRELSIPPDAHKADRAIEVFRGWLIDDGLQCSLLPGVWKDQWEGWGILLADAAHHMADALADSTGKPRPVIMAKIVKALLRELSEPTDEHTGEFVPPP